MINVPDKQRALVFQGGGALGAYEAGAFKAIYNHIIEKEGKHSEERLFDVVAGTSIGAINATLVVDYVKRKKTWKGTVEVLEDFWNQMKNMTWADNPFFPWWWNGLRLLAGSNQVALPETARRYWSWAQLACTPPIYGGGTLHLYFPHIDLIDMNFLNPFVFPHGFSYDYRPLKEFLEDRISFPIKTEPGEPRLLVVSVDVKDCTTAVTFDSYATVAKKCDICEGNMEFDNNRLLVLHMKEDHVKKLNDEYKLNMGKTNYDNLWYSVYGEGENNNNKHVVFYDGIGLEQLTAGCMIPQSIDHPSLFDYVSRENRTYWDGGLLSNTPLRELLQRHKDYWSSYSQEEERAGREKQHKRRIKKQNAVPNLEVFIIDLFPAVELDKQIPSYGDIIQDRINDIRFHDRTVYDQKVSLLVSDYVSLTNSLMDLCKRLLERYFDKLATPMTQIDLANELLNTHVNDRGSTPKSKIDSILTDFIKKRGVDKEGKSENIISRILREDATSYHRSGRNRKRKYDDLLRGTFNVEVTRIERQDDPSTISGKIGDFSKTSIGDLMTKGEQETEFYLGRKNVGNNAS
jgi:NTE family protein